MAGWVGAPLVGYCSVLTVTVKLYVPITPMYFVLRLAKPVFGS